MKVSTCKNTFLLLAFLLLNISLSGQEFKMKFGKIDQANLEMQQYEKDTSVAAMVIGDFGDVKFSFISGGFKIVFDRHIRIKIFKKEGYGLADYQLRLYSSGGRSERLSKLSGATYNLEKGKIEKSKLTNKAIFKEDESKDVQSIKFTMPDVKEGSIIEYQYTIASDFLFNLPEWQFQRSIPVLWSEYNASVPEFFYYKQIVTGYEALDISDVRTTSDILVLDAETNNKINFLNNVYRMVGIDIPPFVSEPMLTTADNYLLKIKFELASENYPNTPSVLHTQSWESINKNLVERQDFYGQLSGGNFLKDAIEEIKAATDDPYEQVKGCFEYIKNHMKWNNYNSKYITSTLRSAFNDESGNSADINLMLVTMLGNAGFKANPVILSTRANGIINPYIPLISTFNYVIARVTYDDKVFLLDATDPFATFNVLPQRCLNGQGRIIDKVYTDWQDLNPGGIHDYKCNMVLTMNGEGDFTGSMVNDRIDYAAYSLRKMIDNEKSEEDFIESMENNNSGLEIETYKFDNLDDVYKPVKEEYKLKISGQSDIAGDMIYFNPWFYERVKSNPFKLEDRKYPIDFAYPINEVFTVSITIPEGYSVEELPANITLNLPDNSARFILRTSFDDGVINLTNEFQINKSLFIYDEYKSLKDFYDQMVSKHSEMVVLKKN